jgi:hypothetical protein
MSLRLDGTNPLSYMGVRPYTPPQLTVQNHAPTQYDINFPLGTFWLDKPTQKVYELVSLSGPLTSPPQSNYAVWALSASSGGVVTQFDADTGVAIPAGGIINVNGDGVTIRTEASGNTIEIIGEGTLAAVFDGNTGTATPALNVINIVGDGTLLTSSATGNTVTTTIKNSGTEGQVIISGTSTAAWASLTAGTGISITPGNNSITIANTGASAETWVDVTTGTQAMAVNTGYVADFGTLVTLTLPATALFGSRLTVTGKGAGGWLIAQNSGQTIYFGTSTTMTGTGGSLASTQQRDTVDLVCVTANTDWNVLNSVGNITVT